MNSLGFSYSYGFVVAWEAVKPTQAWVLMVRFYSEFREFREIREDSDNR